MLSQIEVDAVLDAFASWDDEKKAEYGNVYRESHSSSLGFQEVNLKLPIIGVLVYCVSLVAFTIDFLSQVTGWKLLSALPWVLHENIHAHDFGRIVRWNVLYHTLLSIGRQ